MAVITEKLRLERALRRHDPDRFEKEPAMKFKSEKDLAKVVVKWLTVQHWEVWQEVRFGRGGPVHDIVALRGRCLWIIECKKTLGWDVLAQAWRANANLISVATPHAPFLGTYRTNNKGRFLERVCRDYGIGILFVSPDQLQNVDNPDLEPGDEYFWDKLVEEQVRPKFRRNLGPNRYRDLLETIPKAFAQAGTKDGKYWTPYKETMDNVRQIIEKFPGCDAARIQIELKGKHHYSGEPTGVRSSIQQAILNWEKGWCRAEKVDGKYRFFVKAEK